jgi:hypothetical protein
MLGNCSTRDGRSRIVGPRAPHVTWTNPAVPESFSFAIFDVQGTVYALVDDGLQKGDLRSGAVIWTTPFVSSPYEANDLFFTSDASLEGFTGLITGPTFDSFNTTTGAADVVANLGALFNNVGQEAIGADGSFYFVYYSVPDPPTQGTEVAARLTPAGVIAWTSALEPANAGPFPEAPGVTLGANDLVLTCGEQGLIALDPETGASVWTSPICGNINVGPDGSIVLWGEDGVVTLDGNGAQLSTASPPVGLSNIVAIARDGTLLFWSGNNAGNVAAMRGDTVLWTVTGQWGGIDETDTVLISTDDSIQGLDLSTGARRWKVEAPKEVRPICVTFYLAQGEVAALQCCNAPACDVVGAFGASD